MLGSRDVSQTPSVEVADEQRAPSLTSRLLTPRTALSIAATVIIVFLAVRFGPVHNWGDVWNQIRHANLGFYALAFGTYYFSFVVRALRWQLLLDNAGARRSAAPLGWIILISFFVNCVVPAKMGDVYRAYLVRNQQRVAGTMALGTVIAERLLDLCVLMALLLLAGAIVFHASAPQVLIPYAVAGTAICLVGVAALLVMRAGRGQRFLRLLPEAVFHRYESFRVGTVHSLGRLPLLGAMTVAVWALEGTRLGLVITALGYGAQLGPAHFLLLALIAALLTTIPFLPGGVGLVEGGMAFVLVSVFGVESTAAAAITILDRSISYVSVVVFGMIAFAAMHVRMSAHAGSAEAPST